MHEEERHAPRSRKPTTQTRFVTSGPPETTDTERVVQEVLAQLGQDPQRNRGGRRRKPTPGQSESGVQNGRNSNPLPVLLLGIVDADALPLLRADPVVEEKQRNVTIARVWGTLPESAHPGGSTK